MDGVGHLLGEGEREGVINSSFVLLKILLLAAFFGIIIRTSKGLFETPAKPLKPVCTVGPPPYSA